MRVYHSFLMLLGIAAAFAAPTSLAQAQSSPSETPAFHKLREDMGLEPRTDVPQDGVDQTTVSPALEVPEIDPPAPAAKALTADDFKHPVAIDKDLFSIAFPGQRQDSEDKERHAREYHYSPGNGKTEFHVEVMDVPAEVNDANAQRLFDMIRDQILQSPPSRLITDRERPQSSHPGRELVLQLTGPGQTDMLHLRFVFAAHRFYMISVKHSQEMAASVATAFLDSFHVASASRVKDGQGLVPTPAPAPIPAPAPVPAPVDLPAPSSVPLTVDDFKNPTVFTSENFAIAFPAKFRKTEDNEKDHHARQYNCVTGGMEFGVSVTDMSSAVNDSNVVVSQFNNSRDQFCKLGPAQLISERDCSQGTHPGREFNFQWKGEHVNFISMRQVYAAHRIYVVAVGHNSNPPSPVVEAFLDSFQVDIAERATIPAATLGAIPAPAPAATAYDFKHPAAFTGDKFIVAFPGKVETTDNQDQHSRNYRSADGKTEFGVAVFDLSAEETNAASKMLDATRDILVKKLNAQLISEQNRPANGHPGRELKLQLTAQNQSIGIRLVVAEQRLYVVMATHAAGVDPSVDEAFLDSFKAAETVNSPQAAQEFNNLFK